MLSRRAFVAGGLALAGTRARAQPLPAPPADALQALAEAEVERARSRHGATLALVLGTVGPRGFGRLHVAAGEGLRSATGRAVTLDRNTPFEIGSVSKVFTACLHVRRHGRFAGTLGEWLAPRRLSPAVAAIPLADLARYQPGLPQDNGGGVHPPGTLADFERLFPYLAQLHPPAPPGTCYAYSNLGWSLLALAGHGARQGSAAAFVRRYEGALSEYCAAFGARDTRLFDTAVTPRLPAAYHRRNWQKLRRPGEYQPSGAAAAGSGGIVSTGADMLAFLRHQMGLSEGGAPDPVLGYTQSPDFAVPRCDGGRAPRTAYGWFHSPIATPSGAVGLLTKDGAVSGFTAWIGFVAWQGTGAPSPYGVFVLANAPGAAGLGMRAMRLVLGA